MIVCDEKQSNAGKSVTDRPMREAIEISILMSKRER